MLDDAFDGAPPLDELRLFRELGDEELRVARRMLASGLNSPRAHGVGRYFDAFGALGLNRRRSSFEGQLALEWNMAALAASGDRGHGNWTCVRWCATPRTS
jgi:hydrogenase maturation protein HypF